MKNLTIGVLGGMGTYATINLFNVYADIFKAEKEWERPRIIIDNRCTMPSRVRALLYNEKKEELINEMTESMTNLEKIGATRIILACMTSHLFLKEIYKKNPNLEDKVLNLVNLCVKIIEKDNIKEIYLLGSEGTIDSNIFQDALKKKNIKCLVPKKDEYKIVRDCIEAVKQNKYTKDVKEKFLDLINRNKYCILGCSELPILCKKYQKGINSTLYDPFLLGIKELKKEYDND